MNWIFITFIIFSIIPLGIAAFLGKQIRDFQAKAKNARGVVVRQDSGEASEENLNQNKNVIYAPVIRFPDTTGSFHEFTSPVGSNPPRWPNGSAIDVIYDPEHPEMASINQPMVLWRNPLILIAIGFVMLIGAILNFK